MPTAATRRPAPELIIAVVLAILASVAVLVALAAGVPAADIVAAPLNVIRSTWTALLTLVGLA